MQARRGGGRVRRGLVLLLLLALPVGLLSACQHSIRPPASVSRPARVYVIDYGQHASLALPAGERRLVEWSWGDWHYFARRETGLGSGVRALFASRRSTLSRRELAAPRDDAELARRVGAQEVLGFDVEAARAQALLARLEARWGANKAGAISHADGRIFVPDAARYGLTNNSVHELGRWLRALGVEVRGGGVTARFRQLPPAPVAAR